MDIKSNQSKSQKNLDAEFRRILRIIKPYIPYINNNEYITQYRLWLEKLSHADYSEKKERNRYLQELLKQIEAGILEVPFCKKPTPGPLIPYHQALKKSKNGDNVYYNQSNFQENREYSLVSPISSCEEYYSSFQAEKTPELQNDSGYNIQTYYANPNQPYPMYYVQRSSSHNNKPPSNGFNSKISINNQKKCLALKKRKLRQSSTIPSTKTSNKSKSKEDDSSWCDLTEGSTVTSWNLMGSGDSGKTAAKSNKEDRQMKEAYESRISKMVDIIKRLEDENKNLSKQVETTQRDLDIRNANAKSSIHNLSGEVENLKKRLQELLDIKSALQESAFSGTVNSEIENTLIALQRELKETKDKNSELQNIIGMLETKLDDYELNKKKENVILKNKLAQLHQKEIEMTKELHQQKIEQLENSYRQKIVEDEHINSIRMEELKNHYEHKMLEQTNAFQKAIIEKDTEIKQLETTVQEQCSKMEQEVKFIRSHLKYSAGKDNYEAQIAALEKCMAKMEKVFKKSEREYQKQIVKLKKEIERQEKANQLLLTSQRIKLTSSIAEEKQKEIEMVVGALEERYKKLIENILEGSITDKKNDEKVIAELREKLNNHILV